jgi:hypothetical protein
MSSAASGSGVVAPLVRRSPERHLARAGGLSVPDLDAGPAVGAARKWRRKGLTGLNSRPEMAPPRAAVERLCGRAP